MIKPVRKDAFGSSGAVRAAVFGINDGLVSNISLILGVAGASANPGLIFLSGIAGLGAGAFSMAAGEYISMRSQRDLFEYQIALQQNELESSPDKKISELAHIYTARGLSESDAHMFAAKILQDKTQAIDTLAREKLGLNPNELGSPWRAALSSFVSFSTGALIPLLPFLYHEGVESLKISMLLVGIALFTVGMILGLLTGRSLLFGGFRMLMIGVFAGATTFSIGRIFGVDLL